MSFLKRTTSADIDFQNLVALLDRDLQIRDGDEHSFYAQFNKIDSIKNVVVYYEENEPIGCGAFKQWEPTIAEIKRMFVKPEHRSKGIASVILNELENWAIEIGFTACVLETGKKQPEAIRLYIKNNYAIIPNFGQYENVENSVCMKKELIRQN